MIMNKTKLERFIIKYSLGGSIDSVKWIFKNNNLLTAMMTPDKSLIGKVKVDNVDFDDRVLGVYSTGQLSRMLSVLDGNLDVSLVEIDQAAISLKLKSNGNEVNFALADLSVFEDPPSLKNLPDFDLHVDVDSNFSNTFIKGKTALSEIETFSLIQNGTTKIVIGHSNTNSHRVSIPLNVKKSDFPMERLTFNANVFKEILVANRECTLGELKFSDKGLLHIKFDSGDYHSEYFLTAIQDDN